MINQFMCRSLRAISLLVGASLIGLGGDRVLASLSRKMMTNGTVIESEPSLFRCTRPKHWFCRSVVVEFGDGEGSVHRATGTVAGPHPVEVGQRIKVLYSGNDPQNAVIGDSEGSLQIVVWLIVGAYLLLIAWQWK